MSGCRPGVASPFGSVYAAAKPESPDKFCTRFTASAAKGALRRYASRSGHIAHLLITTIKLEKKKIKPFP